MVLMGTQEWENQINSSFLIHASGMIANDSPARKENTPNDHPGQLRVLHNLLQTLIRNTHSIAE